MTVKKLDNGNYQARFQFEHKRYTKNFPTSKEAKSWEAKQLAILAAGKSPLLQKDQRPLSTLAQLWYDIHGHTLKDGKSRLSRLFHIFNLLGDPPAHRLDTQLWLKYRKSRLDAGNSENNCNRELTYVKALFNELKRAELWHSENPLENIRPLKFDEKDMRYLTTYEIDQLIHQCSLSNSEHLTSVVKLCLATGARWNEANQIERSDIQIINNRALAVFQGTKSRRIRRIPISPELGHELLETGNKNSYRLFWDCTSSFRRAVEKAGIDLPRGQMTHVLRHTFASHFMMNGGDILQLKEILGHSTLTMTIRYAHLAPDALEQAIRFNPLSGTEMAHEK